MLEIITVLGEILEKNNNNNKSKQRRFHVENTVFCTWE